jgi:methylenetetrahydrofolate reductase (NADPH)
MTLIRDILKAKRPSFSFEIFPPKPDAPLETVYETVSALRIHKPDFISVTYGGGGQQQKSDGRHRVHGSENRWGQVALAHRPASGGRPGAQWARFLEELDQENVLRTFSASARRPPRGGGPFRFRYALDLIRQIRAAIQRFLHRAAALPGGHIECDFPRTGPPSAENEDGRRSGLSRHAALIRKRNFLRVHGSRGPLGISVPVVAGVMPFSTRDRSAGSFRCAALPFLRSSPASCRDTNMRPKPSRSRIAYATEQIIDLVSWGVCRVHLYTMNRPDIAERIMKNIGTIRESVTRER